MTAHERGTIFLEEGRVLEQAAFEARQFVIRIEAPRCAAHATPGSFAHIACDPKIPMRRPLSLMRADPAAGTVDILYKVEGAGLEALSRVRAGEVVSLLGPIGRGFTPHTERPRALLVGGGVGIPPVIFLAERLRARTDAAWQPLAFLGSEIPFPFAQGRARASLAGIGAGVDSCMTLLEEWGVGSRLASRAGLAGCFPGFVTELAEAWLAGLDEAARGEVEIFACGPTPMLKATAQLARRQGVACQVALEEFMACAVGGCAGCTVLVQTPAGPAMKRVCVDGPVFDADSVFGAAR